MSRSFKDLYKDMYKSKKSMKTIQSPYIPLNIKGHFNVIIGNFKAKLSVQINR